MQHNPSTDKPEDLPQRLTNDSPVFSKFIMLPPWRAMAALTPSLTYLMETNMLISEKKTHIILLPQDQIGKLNPSCIAMGLVWGQ